MSCTLSNLSTDTAGFCYLSFGFFSYDEISFDNDLALLHLNESVEWRDNVRPICLPDSQDENHQGIK